MDEKAHNRKAAKTATDFAHKELNDGDFLIAKAREVSRAQRERALEISRDEDVRGMGFGYAELDQRIERDGINLDNINT